ncbi:MAG: aspartyl protease family protein [Phycisphaerae bacterium]|nr:aspartyl protease family protein [Phycisphaerae bacterium]
MRRAVLKDDAFRVLGVIVASAIGCAIARAETVQDIVEHVRSAQGSAPLERGRAIHLKGAGQFLGNEATIDLVFDDEGRSVLERTAAVPNISGFDGKESWTLDLGGEVRRTSLGEQESVLFGANVISGWWFSAASGMEFSLDESRADPGAATLGFSHDRGRATGSVTIDRATWRATRWTLDLGAQEFTWELSGALEVAGRTFPSSVRLKSNGGFDSTIEFVSGAAERVEDTRFSMPSGAEGSHRFDPALPAALEIKKAPTGHLLVRGSFDGGEAGWFIFDTGAGMNCIDTGLIEARGYRKVGEVPAMGVGGSVSSPLVRPESLRVGRLTLDHPLCVGLDLKGIAAYMGEPIMGIVGYNAIACSIAEIDSSTPRVSLLDPKSYVLERGQWTPMVVYERHPCFEGSIEGHKGMLKIDTGAGGKAGGALTVHADAVERFGLLDGRETQEAKLGGVGGFVSARRGVLSVVEFGGTRHENIEATFALENKAAFADPYVIGNVSGTMLAEYTLVLDYGNGRAALVRRE